MTTQLSTAGIGIKPLVSLRKHPKLAVSACLLTLLASLPLIWVKGQASYSSDAVVQVAPRYMKNLKDDNELDFQSNSQYRQFVQQQMSTLTRYDILRDGLAQSGLPRPKAESEQSSIKRLRNLLEIQAIPDTYMVRVSLSGKDKTTLAPLVNAIVKVYLERARHEQVFGKDDRITQLKKRQDELLTLIEQQSERRNQISGDLGVATFSVEAGNPYDKAIERLRDALAEIRIKRLDAQAHEQAFLKHGETDTTIRSIQESVATDPGLNSLKASLNNRRAILVAGMATLTSQHPGYQQSALELAQIEQELNQQTEKLSQSVRANLRNRYATSSSQALELETRLDEELKNQESSRERYAYLFKEAKDITGTIDQMRKEVESIQDRLNFFAAETSSFGFVRLVSHALQPELPQGPGYKKLALMAILAALVAGLLLPILLDQLDRTIHAPNDVISSFGFAPVGWLVQQSDPDSRAFYDDQIRRLASAMMRDQDRTGLHIFGITALQPGGGSTTLTLELKKAFESMGVSALAIEANAFKQDSRYAQALNYTVGTPLPDTIPDGLLRLTSSRRHIQHTDLLREVLPQLAKQYRFVLVDIPPLLLSGDAELCLRATPAVLAVVEAEVQNRGEVARAARVLQNMDPASIGVVVNQVRPLDGGGYVRDLIAEFNSGRRSQKPSLLSEIGLTAKILGKASIELLQGPFSKTATSRGEAS